MLRSQTVGWPSQRYTLRAACLDAIETADEVPALALLAAVHRDLAERLTAVADVEATEEHALGLLHELERRRRDTPSLVASA
ncbi:MAG: hypothetical protein ACNA8R_13195 [Nitriliruptoraceae bacterium]